MAGPVAILIQTDPYRSHRPSEAVRIALGLASNDHEVRILLTGRALLLLGDDLDDVMDAEILQRYLPTFRELEIPFYVEATAWNALAIESDQKIVPLSLGSIADEIAAADTLMVF